MGSLLFAGYQPHSSTQSVLAGPRPTPPPSAERATSSRPSQYQHLIRSRWASTPYPFKRATSSQPSRSPTSLNRPQKSYVFSEKEYILPLLTTISSPNMH